MKIKGYAKINLSLDVLGTLPNGYHEVCMIMQSVDLHDTLEISPADGDSIILTCDNDKLVCDESNLVIRAATLLMQHVGRRDAVNIRLQKSIPMAAGLAGGSADAAATLVGLNEMFEYGLDIQQLKDIGDKLGADIPFCIQGGTCLSEGIGERLTPISAMPNAHIVLVKPPIDVSTKYVYDHLVLDETTLHPNVMHMRHSLDDGSLSGIASGLGNILETVTTYAYPEINDIKKALTDNGALGALMSGSGPTVFGIFDDKTQALTAAAHIRDMLHYSDIHICRPTDHGTEII